MRPVPSNLKRLVSGCHRTYLVNLVNLANLVNPANFLYGRMPY